MSESRSLAFIVMQSMFFFIDCGSSSWPVGVVNDASNDVGDSVVETSIDDERRQDASPDEMDVGGMTMEVSRTDASAEGDPISDHDLCQQSCDVTAAVPCPDHLADCVQICDAAFAEGLCVPERRTYDECKVAATSAAFTCSPPGLTELMPSFCRAETDAVRLCTEGDGGSD